MTLDTRAAGILTLVAFLSGGIAGATAHKVLTEKPAKPPVRVVDCDGPWPEGPVIIPGKCLPLFRETRTAMEAATAARFGAEEDLAECQFKNRVLQTLNNREGRQDPVTPQNPSLDPQTAEWYRLMTEKGYVPMTIMVPKGSR